MKKRKPETVWGIRTGSLMLLPFTVRSSRRYAINAILQQLTQTTWAKMYRRGYRACKLEISNAK